MIFNYLSLITLLCVSLVIVREDLKMKKIRNKWIVLGFLVESLLLVVAYVLDWIDGKYAFDVLENVLSASLIGFIIWRLGFWPAGDAKFFTLVSFILPLQYYAKYYLPIFPSFIFLVNIFVSFLIFLSLRAVYFLVQGGWPGFLGRAAYLYSNGCSREVPFAPWIFTGTVVTLLLQGSLLVFIYGLF